MLVQKAFEVTCLSLPSWESRSGVRSVIVVDCRLLCFAHRLLLAGERAEIDRFLGQRPGMGSHGGFLGHFVGVRIQGQVAGRRCWGRFSARVLGRGSRDGLLRWYVPGMGSWYGLFR